MLQGEIMTAPDSELIVLAYGVYPYAQNRLGAKLAQLGGDKNLSAALYWFLLAVESGFVESIWNAATMLINGCLLYTSPSPRDGLLSRMPSSA